MASIQFIGKEVVTEMFENRGFEVWSIWDKKTLNHKGTGSEELEEYLSLLMRSNFNPVYTLQVYQHAKHADEINSKTAHDGSYNFKLHASDTDTPTNNFATSKIAALEKRIGELENDSDDQPNKLGMIGDILDHPTVQAAAPVIISTLLSLLTGKAVNQPQQGGNNYGPPVALSGINDDGKINEAIRILKEHDTRLGDHLMKLAMIAKNKKDSFQFLLNALETM